MHGRQTVTCNYMWTLAVNGADVQDTGDHAAGILVQAAAKDANPCDAPPI